MTLTHVTDPVFALGHLLDLELCAALAVRHLLLDLVVDGLRVGHWRVGRRHASCRLTVGLERRHELLVVELAAMVLVEHVEHRVQLGARRREICTHDVTRT